MECVNFSVVVFREGASFSAWCPDLDIADQGDTAEEAIANLREAIELHLECLSPAELREIKSRGPRFVTSIEAIA
ncbi:MAG: type II toxin-antitoxin system HicB family antitoxin [Candidatus Micrarchaeota archaeon]